MFVINQRQSQILKLLRRNKHLITDEIAIELGVTDRTIRNDLLFLRKEFHQIEIRKGRYGGGVYWND